MQQICKDSRISPPLPPAYTDYWCWVIAFMCWEICGKNCNVPRLWSYQPRPSRGQWWQVISEDNPDNSSWGWLWIHYCKHWPVMGLHNQYIITTSSPQATTTSESTNIPYGHKRPFLKPCLIWHFLACLSLVSLCETIWHVARYLY